MYTQAIAYHAENSPASIAIVGRNGEVTYARFDAEINCVALGLRDLLPSEAKIIGVQRSFPYADWLLTLALARLNRVTVSVPGGPFPTQGYEFVDCVISLDLAYSAGSTRVLHITKEQLQAMLGVRSAEVVVGASKGTDPARIAVSSGTTGTPKGIELTHAQVISRLKGGIFGSAMRNDRRVYCELPIGTFGGFGVPLRTWYLGGTVYLGSITTNDLRRGNVRTVVTTPGGLDAIVSKLMPEATAIRGLCVVAGGGHVSPSLVARTLAKLSTDLVLTYGSTETTTVAMCQASMTFAKPGLTGVVLPWVDLQVVGDDGMPLPAGEAGNVRIRCVDMIDKYIDDPEASGRAFRDGWFYPGDIGRLDGRRNLSIIGRRDFVLNLNGYKIAAETIEQILENATGVADCAVTQARDTADVVRAVALIVPGPDFDSDTVRAALANGVPTVSNVVVQTVEKIPRNDMTKVERHLLAGLLELPIAPVARAPATLAPAPAAG